MNSLYCESQDHMKMYDIMYSTVYIIVYVMIQYYIIRSVLILTIILQ